MVISMSIYFKLFIALVFWGLNVVLMKSLSSSVPFILLSLLKIMISFLFLCFYMVYKRIKINYRDFYINCLIGFLMFYLNNICTMFAQKYIEGPTIALLNSLSSVSVIFLGMIFFHKKISYQSLSYCFLIILAFCISIDFKLHLLNIGFYSMLCGLCCYNVGYYIYEKYNIKKGLDALFVQLMFALLCLFIHTFFINNIIIEPINSIYIILFIIISGYGFVYIQCIYLESIDKIGQLKTSQIFSFVPLFVFVFSLLFLNSQCELNMIISMIMIIIANLRYF